MHGRCQRTRYRHAPLGRAIPALLAPEIPMSAVHQSENVIPRLLTPADFNAFGQGYLPDQFGIVITQIEGSSVKAVTATLEVTKALMAPNGCLHGGAVMVLADTVAGYGCLANLPPGALGFLTSEMKANHLSAMRGGTVVCVGRPVHLGRRTQVWDAAMSDSQSGKLVALFRCTQFLMYAGTASNA